MAKNIDEYDLIVLGSGEAGKYIAWYMSSLGKKTIVVERRYIGGSCPNIACLPSKNVIHSAKVASYFKRSAEFGIHAGSFSIDMAGVRERKREMVRGLLETHLSNFKRNATEIALGQGRFVDERTLRVEMPDGQNRTLKGSMVVISTGTRAKIDDIPGLAGASPLTHVEALELEIVPQHLIVLGGGYVGLEFAQALRRLGSRVTVLERSDRLLPREDLDVSDALRALFADEGIDVITKAIAVRITGRTGDFVSVELEIANESRRITGTHLLAATGRIPNTEDIGLEVAGVSMTDRGYIQVNERLETTAPNVWAVGDCAGSPLFTHIAFDDFRVFRDNFAGKDRVTTGRQVPFCLFTDPELARVGLTETEATKAGISYRLGKLPMSLVLRARTLSETRGFLKVLISAVDDTILGVTGFGSGAGELLPPIQLAMAHRLPYTSLRDMVIVHPTIAEGLVFLFGTVTPIPGSTRPTGH